MWNWHGVSRMVSDVLRSPPYLYPIILQRDDLAKRLLLVITASHSKKEVLKIRYNSCLMKYILTISLLFLAALTFSQPTFIDSLSIRYNQTKVDTAKIDFILFASDYLRDTKPEAAISFGKAALKIAQKIQDSKREMLLLDLIGQGYDQVGDIANSISFFNASFKIATEIHDLKAIAAINLNLGACYTDIGNGRLGADYYKSAADGFAKLNDNIGLCKSEVYLSDALFKAKDPDKALYYLEKVKPLSLQLNGYLLHYVYTNFAECYFMKNEFQLAKNYVLQAMVISQKLNDLYALSADNLVLAKVYLALDDLAKAEIFVKKGLEIAEQTKIRENLIDAYNLYSKIYEKQGKYADALKFKTRYIVTKDSLEFTLNDYILHAYENEKKDGEVAVMKAGEIRKDAELKRQHFIIAVGFCAFLLLLCIAGYIYYSRNTLRIAHLETERAYQEVNRTHAEIIGQNEALIKNNVQISRQSEDIKKLSNLKDRLFSIISHDLRGPFRNLQTVLNLLLEGTLSQDKFQTIIPQLVKGVSSSSDLVENLLHWSKSQLTGAMVVGIDLNIYGLVQNQLSLFEKQAADKQLELRNETSLNTIVYADKDMIDLVLRNLVANAIKFCHPKGRIIISSKQIENHIEISVTDQGIGISPENIHKVFQEEERFTTRGTGNEAGTGLGLLLCKDFVEKNNGIIGVESKLNEGSRFWFTLPKGSGVVAL